MIPINCEGTRLNRLAKKSALILMEVLTVFQATPCTSIEGLRARPNTRRIVFETKEAKK